MLFLTPRGPRRRRCAEWASASRGQLDFPGTAIPLPLSVLASRFPEPLREWVRLGLIKDPARAARKALARYGGDVSRLGDLARCRIAFAALADLEACAAAVCAGQAGVTVVGARSTLNAKGGAGGFRAFVLRVRFDTAESRGRGAENHVCEVQVSRSPSISCKTFGST